MVWPLLVSQHSPLAHCTPAMTSKKLTSLLHLEHIKNILPSGHLYLLLPLFRMLSLKICPFHHFIQVCYLNLLWEGFPDHSISRSTGIAIPVSPHPAWWTCVMHLAWWRCAARSPSLRRDLLPSCWECSQQTAFSSQSLQGLPQSRVVQGRDLP